MLRLVLAAGRSGGSGVAAAAARAPVALPCLSGRHTARPLSTSAADEESREQEPERDQAGDADAFRRTVLARHAARAFLPDPIPENVLEDILALTMRAPSSFNAQPWACVVVRDGQQREALAQAMLGGNPAKVRAAPATAVFLADLEPSRRLPRLQEESRRAGAPEAFVARLPALLALFGGEGAAAEVLRRGVTAALSPLAPMPSVTGAEAWATKHAALAAMTYMHAASAHGLATAPMEGFDGRRVRAVLDVPDRYGIALAVATGYEDPQSRPPKPSWRFPPEEMVFLDRFGEPAPGVPPL